MQFLRMLIHCSCRLGTAIALGAIEIPRSDGVLTESALEGYLAIDPSRGVVAHSFIVVP